MEIIQRQEVENLNNNTISRDQTDIQKFYEGTNVFITGGTGFMGKVLIEKLLRCTDVNTLYLLVREKKGKNMQTRMDELFEDNFFQRLRIEVPKWRYRVVGVAGDCSMAGLGMSINDRKMLIENIDIVFHAAATVRFDEKLKLAFSINVNGTKEIITLCKQMEKLKSVMHVSTAYSNCHLKEIDEVFYQYQTKYDDMGALLNKMDDRSVEELTPKIIGKWPNTYTFTKALAESLIQDLGVGLPLGVFRPAIVVSTYKEPIQGWIDNLYGPTGVCAGVMTGVLRVLHCDDDVIANIVPVDLCVYALIAGAWEVGTQKCERTIQNIPIYNYVSSVDNPLTWSEYMSLNMLQGQRYPSINLMWALRFKCIGDKSTYNFYKWIVHTIPALVFDTFTLLCGSKPRLLNLYRKIHKFSEVISYFCTRNWRYTNTNTIALWSKLSEKDKQLFPFNIKELPWQVYFRTYISGIRQYLLKDSLQTIPKAQLKLRRLETFHSLLKYVLSFVSAHVIFSAVSRCAHLAISRFY